MKISKTQIRRIIREEKEKILDELDVNSIENGDHHWPRVDWDNASDLVDKWHDMEMKYWDPDDPSMFPDGSEMSQTDAKDYWSEQVESAAMDLDNELTIAIRQLALNKMKEISMKLINGEYA